MSLNKTTKTNLILHRKYTSCSCGLFVCLPNHCPALFAADWASYSNNDLFLAPYLGTDSESLDAIFKISDFSRGERLLDIGAGDGRVLIKAINYGAAYVQGWEIQKEVYELALSHLKSSLSVSDLAKCNLILSDAKYAKFDDFDVIFLYLLPSGLKLIKPYLDSIKVKTNSSKIRIITQGWPIEEWKFTSTYTSTGGSVLFRYDIINTN